MKFVNNLPTAVKLITGFGTVILLLIIVSATGYLSIGNINGYIDTMYTKRTLPLEYASNLLLNLYTVRGDVYKYILLPEERTQLSEEISNSAKEIDTHIDLYKQIELDQEETTNLNKFEESWKEYYRLMQDVLKQIDAGETQKPLISLASGGEISNARKSAFAPLDNLQTLNIQYAGDLEKHAEEIYTQISLVIIIITILAILIAIILTWLITTSMNTPLRLMAGALQSLCRGDLNRNIPQEVKNQIMGRSDEIGIAGKGLGATEIYMIDMATAAQRIAAGDLTIQVTPKGETDELGVSFAKMVEGLRTTVSQVAENAVSVSTASEQLALAANQAGEATNQISVTIQQIASGTSQQTESVSKTAGSIDQLTRAIDGVAKGAQDQSSAINQTSLAMQQLSAAIKEIRSGAQEQVRSVNENRTALSQFSESVTKLNRGAQSQSEGLSQAVTAGQNLTEAIQQLASAAGEVSAQVKKAAEAAQEGSSIVLQTTKGMQKVRSATDTLAERVQGLGQRSGEIGLIVSTIDDIASQTNLLALNAAIEAARAGEHGKGFAVVADEVRKLAEKSALATKEIGELVRTVQNGAGDAVAAMQQAGEDVSVASDYTRQASAAFETIVSGTLASADGFNAIQQSIEAMEMARLSLERAIEDVRHIANENKDNSVVMEELNSAIITRLEGVQRVAESNALTAEEMAKLNEGVIELLDNTSAIVEENTAATEEMNASSAEVSVMVENIASVSEENSAATEEVSASTEEMSAQVEEVTASATALAEMAQGLQKTIAQFQI